MIKNLPKELTSYDLLKALAVILMITDHVGHHFYPDEMWFRVIGRLCVPIWFFLIGYSKHAFLSRNIWIGAILIAASAILSGQYLFPVNILFTILALRWVRQGVFNHAFYSPETLRGMFLILLFLTFPSALIFEYGAIAMMFVMVGHIVRYKQDIYERISRGYILLFVFLTFFSFYLIQGVGFPHLSNVQAIALTFGLIGVGVLLWRFEGKTYPNASRVMAGSFIALFQFLGRRTLEIYVAHILVFRGICMVLYPEKYSLLDWNMLAPSQMAFFLIN